MTVLLFKILRTYDMTYNEKTREVENRISLDTRYTAGRNEEDEFLKPESNLNKFLLECVAKFGSDAEYDRGLPEGLSTEPETHVTKYNGIAVKAVFQKVPFTQKEYELFEQNRKEFLKTK